MTLRADVRLTEPRPATVAVVIPTFNRPNLLPLAVDTVLTQSYPVHEIIIVDDGSNDQNRSTLVRLAQRSPCIRIHLLPKNQGRSRARNEGLARVRSDYVLFLDDDDLLGPGAVDTAMQCFATAADIDVAVCRGQHFGLSGGSPGYLNPFSIDSTAPLHRRAGAWVGVPRLDVPPEFDRISLRTLLFWCPPIHACMIRRDAIGTTRFSEDLALGEDRIFWLDLAIKQCRFRFNPRGRVYTRRHEGNIRRGIPASTVEFERVAARIKGAGREEEFIALALMIRQYQLRQRTGWRRLACSLARFPDLILKYGVRFFAKRAYLTWLEWSGGVSHQARKPAQAASGHRLLSTIGSQPEL